MLRDILEARVKIIRPYKNGDMVKIHVDPTLSQMKILFEKESFNTRLGMDENGVIYLWGAHHATHWDVEESLSKDFSLRVTTYDSEGLSMIEKLDNLRKIKRSESLEEAKVAVYQSTKFYFNPVKSDIKALLKSSYEGVLRGLLDEDMNLVVWDAIDFIHKKAADALLIEPRFHIYVIDSGASSNWGIGKDTVGVSIGAYLAVSYPSRSASEDLGESLMDSCNSMRRAFGKLMVSNEELKSMPANLEEDLEESIQIYGTKTIFSDTSGRIKNLPEEIMGIWTDDGIKLWEKGFESHKEMADIMGVKSKLDFYVDRNKESFERAMNEPKSTYNKLGELAFTSSGLVYTRGNRKTLENMLNSRSGKRVFGKNEIYDLKVS